MNPSDKLFLIGPTGAGKTSVGRRLAMHYHLPFLDLDQEIERHCGVPVATVFEIEGEHGFRRRESQLLDELTHGDGLVLSTGAGVVLDEGNRRCLAARGFVLWLDAGIDQQLARLARDNRRPLLAGGDRRARLEAMAAARTSLYRELADLALPGDHDGVALACEHAIALIDARWQRAEVA